MNLRELLERIILSCVIIFLLLSCSKNQEEPLSASCNDEHLGQFNLLNSSLRAMPYQVGQKLIFTDSMNNEVSFSVFIPENNPDTLYCDRAFRDFCEHDTKVINIYRYDCQCINRHLKSNYQDFDFTLNITLDTKLFNLSDRDDLRQTDEIALYKEPFDGGNLDVNSYMHIMVDERNFTRYAEVFLEPIPSITLQGRSFKDVYLESNGHIYYNYEYGVVALTDSTGKLWVLK